MFIDYLIILLLAAIVILLLFQIFRKTTIDITPVKQAIPATEKYIERVEHAVRNIIVMSLVTVPAILLLLFISSTASAHTLQLKGSSLYFEHGGKQILIKKLSAASDFYGYDMMDDQHVFLSCQDQTTAEAVAILTIYDVKTRKERKLDELGGAGESHFAYQRENHLVLYNIEYGIYTWKIDPVTGPVGKPKLVLRNPEEKYLYAPKWIDSRTFEYEEMDNNTGKSVVRKFTLEK